MVQLSFIYPAYNESGRILETLQQTVSYLEKNGISFEIIVSADGTDGTRELVTNLKDSRIITIGSPNRQGKGKGVRTAVEMASGKYIGYADADNKVPISELDKFLPFLEKGKKIVIGSRAIQGAQIENKPLIRRIGSFGFRYVMQAITGLYGIPDTQCGFKFFEAETAKKLFQLQKIDSYMFDVEILILAKKQGLEVVQIPIRWNDDSDTRLNMVRGNIQNIIDLAKIRIQTSK